MIRHKNSEKILICLPTFHSELFWLERAIKSIQSQTYENFDCYIVKDSCNKLKIPCLEGENCKESINYCELTCSKDKRFKFFNLPINCGGAGWGPRNFAIMNTKNNLIAYLDDDNWYEPEHLRLLLDALTNNGADMAYTGSRIINTDNKVIHKRIHPYLPKQGYIDTSEILHKRFLFEKYGGWQWVPKGNDWDIVSRWIPNLKWAHTNQITVNFYLRENCGVHREEIQI
jgi:glycosyltransferase involved in cell wall biosynthesis